MFRKELLVIKVKNGENHHEICRFIRNQGKELKGYEILVLPENAYVDITSVPRADMKFIPFEELTE